MKLFLKTISITTMSVALIGAAHAIDAPGGVFIGQSLDEARPVIEAACTETSEQEYKGAMAAPAKETQTQINCHGLTVYNGASKVEYMFNDGFLAFVWLMLEPEILASIELQLVAEYGDVAYGNDNYRVFKNGEVALRSDPPEILIASKEMMRGITGLPISE